MTTAALAASAVAAVACVTDLQSRRIPNVLTLGATVGALLFHGFSGGLPALGLAAAGWGLGLLLFFPMFALRGLGGGDVKLLAALGAWLGPIGVLWLACWSAIAGGIFAVVVAALSGYSRRALSNVWSMLSYWRVMGLRPHPVVTLESTPGPRLPYSLPIAAGLGMTLWLG